MIDPALLVGPKLVVPRTLWGAILLANALFAVVIRVVPPPPPNGHPPPFIGFVVMGVVEVAASFVVPRIVRKTAFRAAKPRVAEQGPRVFADPEAAARTALVAYQSSFILGVALSTSVSLFGVVVHMLGLPNAYALPFVAAGIVLVAIRFPTVGQVVGPFETFHDATLS